MPVEKDGNLNTPNPHHFGGSLLILLFFLFLFHFFIAPGMRPSKTEVLYSQFLEDIKEGKVAKALVGENQIEYTRKTEQYQTQQNQPAPPEKVYVTTPIPNDQNLPKLLEDKNVEFGAIPPDRGNFLTTLLGWVIPPLIFVAIWGFILNRAQAGAGAALTVGQSKARIYSEGNNGVTFADVAGIDEAKEELQEIVEFLKNSAKYTRIGAKIPKGVLLIGAPGTGKTLLAKAVAGEAGVPFFSISGSEFIELFVGVGAARVRDLFQQAKKQAPCIVFIDELDALGKSRGGTGPVMGGNDEREQTLNQLLTEMDGFEANTGVIILAATNRPEVLDPALRRPGRFDRQIVVDRPDKKGREAILQVHVKAVKLAQDVDLGVIATRTPGFAGADLANLVNEAALLAARQNREAVTMASLKSAIERVIAGLQKKSRVLNEVEKRTVAYHEAGHAIVAALMPGAGKVEKISIVPRGMGALGYTLQLPEEDRFLMAEDEIRGRIATLLAGRSAEEIFIGKISTGASDDIQKATDLAERVVTLYGMSPKLGPVALEKVQQQFLDGFSNPRRSVSPMVAETIDQEVKDIIEGAHHIALRILETNRSLLEEMTQDLLHTEILEGQQLRRYLDQVQAPAELAVWLGTGQVLSVN
ncbi:ATP-dependent zinc metalloprotease FtsH [Chlorogloeopsis sp. ULAP01]|uniref:ATP-dependent zinc metalloprotease FtsH n=1 Tax=Chlorogloeopsis sp. ULAP01 TaxID=3056483 RepID=UPI0025AAFD54|nr:ATP-dependent zinc metalloprotease FtsH [Chlorogloeopsis sp. ULAP01]MDM9384578.1 ATP-dependent zinc metalloprotease FtsH [Chlorogloeopsis sp. ULAP01]